MSEKTRELLAASAGLLPFLEASTDKMGEAYWANTRLSRAERLRREADEIEARDAAIKRFRTAINAIVGLDGDSSELYLEIEDAVRDAIRKELDRK
jgi:hypothetical protein